MPLECAKLQPDALVVATHEIISNFGVSPHSCMYQPLYVFRIIICELKVGLGAEEIYSVYIEPEHTNVIGSSMWKSSSMQ